MLIRGTEPKAVNSEPYDLNTEPRTGNLQPVNPEFKTSIIEPQSPRIFSLKKRDLNPDLNLYPYKFNSEQAPELHALNLRPYTANPELDCELVKPSGDNAKWKRRCNRQRKRERNRERTRERERERERERTYTQTLTTLSATHFERLAGNKHTSTSNVARTL